MAASIKACLECGEVRRIQSHGLCTRCHQRTPASKAYNKAKRAADAKLVSDFIASQKTGPCLDCGLRYPPYVMDFDHRPGEPKIIALSQITRKHRGKNGVALAREEIKKCDLVCSNCHRIRTHERRTDAWND